MKALNEYFLIVVFTLLLNIFILFFVCVYFWGALIFMFNLDRNMAVKGLINKQFMLNSSQCVCIKSVLLANYLQQWLEILCISTHRSSAEKETPLARCVRKLPCVWHNVGTWFMAKYSIEERWHPDAATNIYNSQNKRKYR